MDTSLPISKEDMHRFKKLKILYMLRSGEEVSHKDFITIMLDKLEGVKL